MTALYTTLMKVKPITFFVLIKRSCSGTIRPQPITGHISLRNTEKTIFAEGDKPLVLLYGWLESKEKHLRKFQAFYLDKGFDVASINASYFDLLRPSNAQKIADDVISLATTEPFTNSPIIAHCFSVGAYINSEALVKINEDDQLHTNLGKRICAQIYDSPVDVDAMPDSIANLSTNNRILHGIIKSMVTSYLFLGKPFVTKHHYKASRAFKSNQLKVPSLFLYSKSDPVCFPELLEKIMKDFRDSDIDVWGQCWDDSKHVRHFHKYPEEYISLLEMILNHTRSNQ